MSLPDDDVLPPEMWFEIMLSVPLRFLIRCTGVCKLWKRLIRSPYFISKHLSLFRESPLLLTRSSTADFCIQVDHGGGSSQVLTKSFQCPFRSRNRKAPFRIVGTVDGLMLLVDDEKWFSSDIVIWNHWIHRYVILPRPGFFHDYKPTHPALYPYLVGFGVDSTKDYKVLRIQFIREARRGLHYSSPPMAELYSLRDGTWRTVACPVVEDCMIHPLYYSQCFVNGGVHWIGNYRAHCVLVFDFATEAFHKLNLPEEVTRDLDWPLFRFSLSAVRGVLCVLVGYDLPDNESCIDVWTRRDDSWTKAKTIDARNLRVGTICYDVVKGPGDVQASPREHLGSRFVFSDTISLVLLNESKSKAVEEKSLQVNHTVPAEKETQDSNESKLERETSQDEEETQDNNESKLERETSQDEEVLY